MTTPQHELLRLFRKALELPPAARLAFLDSKCGNDAALKQQLQAMLAAAGDEQFRMAPAALPAAEVATGVAPVHEGPGTTIGPYRLLQQIGEGGFGVVFLAEQKQPVARQVALKIIKLGMDTREVVARFEQERQALALMDHPNIARVIDAGATATGRPYFVMELVKGVPIGEYCDQNSLTVEDRLMLFAQVCSAVQHAHQKGIIHRDLKPSNLLVAMQDGRPQVKVIDFGIAKATSKLTDKTLFTQQEQVIGTLQYMSPEQAAGSLDIDTRTDVYALGVVLYELLTGSTPFDTRLLREAMHSELLRMIREVDPVQPSTRLSESHDTLAALAARRRVEPGRLGSLVRGELDWIVMKALEKDRSRRYESASSLGLDIARHLQGEAVHAAPPSAAYRLRKFVRRNRATVASAVAVAVALLIGVVGFAWQASIARDQRDRARHAEEQTGKRADELQKVAHYQARMLQQIDATATGERLMADLRTRHGAALDKSKVPEADKSARTSTFDRELHAINATDTAVALLEGTVLAPAVLAIDTEFADQPVVEASLRTTLGVVYGKLGRNEQALALYQRAWLLRSRALGDEHRDTLIAAGAVGKVMGQLQQLPEAESAVRKALSTCERRLGVDDEDTLRMKSLLVTQMQLQGRYEEGVTIAGDVLERRRRVLGPDHADTLDTLDDLGRLMMHRGKYEDAETMLRQVVEGRRRLAGADVADALGNLGLVLLRLKQYPAAESCLREALEHKRRRHGEEHPYTLTAINNLASMLMEAGRLDEAESLAREQLEKCRRHRGPEHAETLKAMNVMGQVFFRQDKLDQTEPLYREALATGRRVLGEDHPDTIIWIANMGYLLQRMGRSDEAEPYFREALEKNARKQGESHPYTMAMRRNLFDLLQRQGRLAEAEAPLRVLLDNVRRDQGEDHPETLALTRQLADLLRQQGKSAEAETFLRVLLEKVRRRDGEDHADTLALVGLLGSALRDQGKLAEAEPYFQQALDSSRRQFGAEHANTLLAILRMATLRVARGQHAETVALLTPIEGKVAGAFPGMVGRLRHGSLKGLLGKARGAMAVAEADFTAAEANLLEAQAVFAKDRGERDKETREWRQALMDFYLAWDKAAPGRGHADQSTEWKQKLEAVK